MRCTVGSLRVDVYDDDEDRRMGYGIWNMEGGRWKVEGWRGVRVGSF
jgi:hypothetical protein